MLMEDPINGARKEPIVATRSTVLLLTLLFITAKVIKGILAYRRVECSCDVGGRSADIKKNTVLVGIQW